MEESTTSTSEVNSAINICKDVQHMIDINSDHLETLRTSIPTTSELTKQEIRTLEGKLIKLFSKQLATRASLPSGQVVPALSQYPSLSQWLSVVGVTPESRESICARVPSLEVLKEKTDYDLHRILLSATRLTTTQRNEDLRRLSKALHNLKKYTDVLMHGNRPGSADLSKLELYWDSWENTANRFAPNSEHISGNSAHTTPCKNHQQLQRQYQLNNAEDSLNDYGSQPLNVSSGFSSKVDSAASSLSSTSSSIPPPSPGALPSSSSMTTWDRRTTPPTTPPWSSVFSTASSSSSLSHHFHHHNNKFPTTPPPSKKNSVSGMSSGSGSGVAVAAAAAGAPPISSSNHPPKSKSYESELSNRIDHSGVKNHNQHHQQQQQQQATPARKGRPRLATEPAIVPMDEGIEPDPSPMASPKSPTFTDPGTPSLLSSDPSTPPIASSSLVSATTATTTNVPATTLQVPPKSPRTPRSMGHVISHRFKKTLKPAKCALCQEYMFNGLKCKECKYKCHRDCESNVPPSCGLPDPLVAYYMNHLTKAGSPIMPVRHSQMNQGQSPSSYHGEQQQQRQQQHGKHDPPVAPLNVYPAESSSNTSSCNSSTPSSPAVIVTTSHSTPPHSATSSMFRSHFRFPDPPVSLKFQDQQNQQHQQKVTSPNPIIDTVKSYDSDKTLSGTSGSSGSVGTAYRLDSQDSTTSVDDSSGGTWVSGRQTSISLREWDIAYEELKIGDKIGSGRFSTVHQGNWHGDVAIKILNMENLDDEATLEAFRLDVATFRKTRHENLILFMGACMNPPKLAIVTSLCKGNTLFTHLHLRKDKFQMNRMVIIAQQVAQGMGYLHHRGIVHKDLKTKNIFLEKGKAVITDFGLVNVAGRLCTSYARPGMPFLRRKQEYMTIPEGWLCYLAPEIMRCLRVQPDEADLPFNKVSDIYAFGTVWFELLTMEWPWKNLPPETIIWMVGRGMKPSLANLNASRDVKDILAMCWTFKQENRPDFTDISNALTQIPKKRSLIRSPSHPLHLSRSAESVF